MTAQANCAPRSGHPIPRRARQFGAGLVIWDDGLRDVDVRLRLVFDFSAFLVVGGWPLVAAVAIVGVVLVLVLELGGTECGSVTWLSIP